MSDERKYIVEYSGHGSPYVRGDFVTLLTLEEGKKEAIRWYSIADTIGGSGRVVDYATNEVVFYT